MLIALSVASACLPVQTSQGQLSWSAPMFQCSMVASITLRFSAHELWAAPRHMPNVFVQQDLKRSGLHVRASISGCHSTLALQCSSCDNSKTVSCKSSVVKMSLLTCQCGGVKAAADSGSILLMLCLPGGHSDGLCNASALLMRVAEKSLTRADVSL